MQCVVHGCLVLLPRLMCTEFPHCDYISRFRIELKIKRAQHTAVAAVIKSTPPSGRPGTLARRSASQTSNRIFSPCLVSPPRSRATLIISWPGSTPTAWSNVRARSCVARPGPQPTSTTKPKPPPWAACSANMCSYSAGGYDGRAAAYFCAWSGL